MEEALKWIEERLVYIAENCDLSDEDNKRAYESLKCAKECVLKQESEDEDE